MLLNVDSDSSGQRLDNFLVKMVKNIPKSRIYRMVRTGEVRVNSKRVRVFTKVYQGDLVRVPPLFGMTIGSSLIESTQDDHIERLVHKNGDAPEDVGHEIFGSHGQRQTANAHPCQQGADVVAGVGQPRDDAQRPHQRTQRFLQDGAELRHHRTV